MRQQVKSKLASYFSDQHNELRMERQSPFLKTLKVQLKLHSFSMLALKACSKPACTVQMYRCQTCSQHNKLVCVCANDKDTNCASSPW